MRICALSAGPLLVLQAGGFSPYYDRLPGPKRRGGNEKKKKETPRQVPFSRLAGGASENRFLKQWVALVATTRGASAVCCIATLYCML